MNLTVSNYTESVKNINFSRLPEEMQMVHDKWGQFSKFYKKSDKITEMIDNHLLNMIPFVSMPAAKKKKVTPEKSSKKKNITAIKKKFDDGFEWAIIDVKTAKQIFNDGTCEVFLVDFDNQTERVVEYIESWNENYSLGIEYKTAIEKFNIKLKTESKAPKTKVSATKKTATKKTSSKKKAVSKQAVRKENEVPVMPLEVRFIKRYLSMHDKRVTEKQVSLFYKAIQKSALEKKIRKAGKYADEIMKISKDLSQTYKDMNNSCKFEIPKTLHTKLKKISDSYGVTPVITLIKRFVSLYGNITKEKANRLLKNIENAKKNGKVTSKDGAYTRLNEVQKHLEKFLDSDKLIVTDIQLNGLKGIAGLGK